MSQTLTSPPRHGATGDALVLRAYQRCEWYELALMRHGWTVERLTKQARKIVADYIRSIPYLAEHRREELYGFVVEKSLTAVMKFDPARQTTRYGSEGGQHFDSYIADVMWNRCTDWQRSKGEGNGDRRYGNDNRVVLVDDPDPADHDTDFERLVDERRRARWQQAADAMGWPLSEWIVITLDRAEQALRTAA